MADIKRGQYWKSPQGFEVRVLGVVEGYVVVRRPRAMPFLVGLREFDCNFKKLAIANNQPAKGEGE